VERRTRQRQLLGGPDGVGSLERHSSGGGATSTRRWRDGSGPPRRGLRLRVRQREFDPGTGNGGEATARFDRPGKELEAAGVKKLGD
jgi:hypothetical protein